MKQIPTFKTSDGILLVGAKAKRAWARQDARCNCGYRGEAETSVLGSDGDMPLEWLGCPNCIGSAVGRPLVYRTQSQINAARNAGDEPGGYLVCAACLRKIAGR
jgi:hypothetical protein